MKYQLNKPALQKLRRDLAIRVRALPILKAKETALRLEVIKSQALQAKLEAEAAELYRTNEHFLELWTEYPACCVSTKYTFQSAAWRVCPSALSARFASMC